MSAENRRNCSMRLNFSGWRTLSTNGSESSRLSGSNPKKLPKNLWVPPRVPSLSISVKANFTSMDVTSPHPLWNLTPGFMFNTQSTLPTAFLSELPSSQ